MLSIKGAGLALVATLVLTGIATAPALAQPEFSSTKISFTSTGETSLLKAASSGELTCKNNQGGGEVKTSTTVSTTLKFKECSGKLGGGTCLSEFTTKTLTGELGEVAAAEAASGVGLLFTGEGEVLAEVSCGSTLKLLGSIAGEVEFVSKTAKSSKVIFASTKIHTITTSSEHKPSLEIVGQKATFTTTQSDSGTSSDIFICLLSAVGQFETFTKCLHSTGSGSFSNGFNQLFLL